MLTKPLILVLCTGNSARSQMAEALFREHVGDEFEVRSAGTEPAERIHPMALAAIRERGLDPSTQRPKHYEDFLRDVPVHTVVIVCDGASRSCPAVWPGAAERLLWPFQDPAAVEGSEEEQLAKFREVRDLIEERILEWREHRTAAG